MAGTLTLGGLASGLGTGEKIIGPMQIIGKAIIGTILDQTLTAGDNTFAVPGEAVGVAISFPYVTEPGEVKVRTNLDSGDSGLPVAAAGFMAFGLPSGTTSIILHAGATVAVELTFI